MVTPPNYNETPGDELQPLREVRSQEKSDHWDREDIMDALRVANLHGIPVERLFAKPSAHTTRIPLMKRRAS